MWLRLYLINFKETKMLQSTFSGVPFDFLKMSLDDIRIPDIAHVLCTRTIFGGHSTHPISEAQKAFYLSYMIGETFEGYGLLFNAWKAYVPDVPEDESTAPRIAAARKHVTNLVRELFHLDDDKVWDITKEQEGKLNLISAKTLLVNPEFETARYGVLDSNGGLQNLDKNFHVWPPQIAKAHYLQRVFDTTGAIG